VKKDSEYVPTAGDKVEIVVEIPGLDDMVRLAEPRGSASRRETDMAGVKGLLHLAVDGHVVDVDRLAA
jgi:hypothetical protein